MLKKASLRKWLTFLFFIVAIVFLVLFSKNKGNINLVITDIKSVFGG